MKPTAFPAPATGVSERLSGFTAHLRINGMSVGARESMQVLQALEQLQTIDSTTLRLVSKCVYSSRVDEYAQFDELFDAYWFNRGRSKESVGESRNISVSRTPEPHQSTGGDKESSHSASGESEDVDDSIDEDGAACSSGEGRLIASRVKNLEKVDLREFMTPESMAEAQRIATRLAAAMCDRRSRRRVAANKGSLLDLRRVMRDCISHGSEPIKLFKRRKPLRPVRIVTLLDVSGSMMVYSRVFLAFVKGLVSHDAKTDAYLFHTSLVRISDALRDPDTFRAVNNLSIKAQGFGGGTRIGHNIEQFNRHYAAQAVNGRTVVIILSDGYDTDPPERLAKALKRLKKRNCKIVWLNPLKGWQDYAPVAQGMAAALPYLDVFEAANTLESLAALEPHLLRV